jgi:CheY-like chemotaxis protein
MGSIPLQAISASASKTAYLESVVAHSVPESGTDSGSFTILVIDGDPSDTRLLRLALKWMRFEVPVSVQVTGDCESALNNLCAGLSQPPNIILLDLERQGKRCLKALERLKQSPRTHSIPVIALASPIESDFSDAYAAQANCVVPKPATVEQAELLLRRIERFWFAAASLPRPRTPLANLA